MWDIFARSAFKAILAKFGKKGMTLKEITEKDRAIFNSDIATHFSREGIEGLESAVKQKNGKFFLKKDAGVSQEWAESTIQNALDKKIAKPYDPRKAVGTWGEPVVQYAFDLLSTDNEELPDYVSKDGAFYVEVKTSAFDNGGIIKSRQLAKFDETVNERRFYAFAFHNISTRVNLGKTYKTIGLLYSALCLKSLYLLPYSVVKAHFSKSCKRPHPNRGEFVQLDEKQAEDIYQGEYGTWANLELMTMGYCRTKLHERVKLITRGGMLEHRIRNAFNQRIIQAASKSD